MTLLNPLKRGHGKALAGLAAIALGQAGIAVATALGVSAAFNRIMGEAAPAAFSETLMLVGGLAGLAVAAAWLRLRERLDGERLGQSYIHTIRVKLFEHLVRMPAASFGTRGQGGVMLRFVGDLTAIRNWIARGIVHVIVSGAAAVAGIATIAVMDWRTGLILGVILGIGILANIVTGPMLEATTRDSRRRRSQIASQVTAVMGELPSIQLFGRTDATVRGFTRRSKYLSESMIARARAAGLLQAIAEWAGAAAPLTVLAAGLLRVTTGAAAPSTLVAAMAVAGLLSPRLRELGRVYEYWTAASVAAEKITEFLARPALDERDHQRNLRKVPGAVEVSGLRLRGGPAGTEGISFTVEMLERIAITGPNGSGKSTLLAVLAGLDSPRGGTIRISGQNVARRSLRSLRRLVAMSGAMTPLRRGTIAENLFEGCRLEDAAAARILAETGVDLILGRLPEGEETRIGSGGAPLSAGERQILMLARSLLRDPQVLLLDEADANLDPAMRDAYERAITMFEGPVIMVTHDPATAALCDRIYRLEDGVLRELARDPARESLPRAANVIALQPRRTPP